jgi:hypothetical protein
MNKVERECLEQVMEVYTSLIEARRGQKLLHPAGRELRTLGDLAVSSARHSRERALKGQDGITPQNNPITHGFGSNI